MANGLNRYIHNYPQPDDHTIRSKVLALQIQKPNSLRHFFFIPTSNIRLKQIIKKWQSWKRVFENIAIQTVNNHIIFISLDYCLSAISYFIFQIAIIKPAQGQ